MDKLKTFVVACNAEPTCIVVAENEEEAEMMAQMQASFDIGECDDNWSAYEINSYFNEEDDPYFFGWVWSPGQSYMKFNTED